MFKLFAYLQEDLITKIFYKEKNLKSHVEKFEIDAD